MTTDAQSPHTNRIFHVGTSGTEIDYLCSEENDDIENNIDCSVPGHKTACQAEPGQTEDMNWEELWTHVKQLKESPPVCESPRAEQSEKKIKSALSSSSKCNSYVYKGNDFAVLKQRLERLSKLRAERLESRMVLNSGPDFWTYIRYRKNTMRIAERQSTRAMIHWFGPGSHRKMVEMRLERHRNENDEINVIYSSSWSKSFHGLTAAFGT